jgi:polyhydroxybutyrate depolymerase
LLHAGAAVVLAAAPLCESLPLTRKPGSLITLLSVGSILLAFFSILNVANAGEPSVPLSPGDHTIKLNHGERDRSALIHVPLRAPEQQHLPVVFNFHGGGGHAANQQQYSLMDQLADRETLIVVYPNGTGRLEQRLLTWNAGTCCAYATLNNVDDVGFTIALLKRLEEVIPIDRRRVYATGMSNGAMMAYRLAAEVPQYFAAIAPVAGGMVVAEIQSSKALPVMHFHSVDDPRALYHGGLGTPFPLTKSRVFHPDIDQMIAKWVDHDGCSKEAKIASRLVDERRAQTATRFVYGSCRKNAEVVFWKLTGAGHVWPGGKQQVMERILGPSTDIIDANREMWHFFSRFTL